MQTKLNVTVTASASVSHLFGASGEGSATTSGGVALFSQRAPHTHAAHLTLHGL